MTPRILGRRRTLLLLAAAPAACASPNPNLYTLAVVPGPSRPGAPRTIELRAIALARYLERSQIVRSSEDYRLDVLGNDWWGEPLDAMLARVTIQNLTQRLNGSTVFAENGAISGIPDATLGINIQRMDQNRSGAVVLIAQVSVTRRTGVARTFTITVSPPLAGTPGLVAAMSQAAGQLADHAASMLVV
jgi:uncharacterized lipoprotein YmbA